MVKSAYIHIPFCKSKCKYCSFISSSKIDLKDEYLKTLSDQIKQDYENEQMNTIYFGGGTPSLLSVCEVGKILNHFNFSQNTEITMETNPESVDYSYLRGLYDIGINRLSIGCQTFNDEILKQIGRIHSAGQVINAVNSAKNAGFKNISLDFIYGLPNQTEQMFYSDLEKAVELDIEHISLYGLKLEKGCYFYNHEPENMPDDDVQADMYLQAVELLTKKEFEHYEVSNFSCKGFNSRHNLTYWNNEEYYGFGVSAHGYKNGVRYANKSAIKDYIKDFSPAESKLLSQVEKLEEEIFLGLRKIEGINVSDINEKFGIDFDEKYFNILKKYTNLNLLEKTKNGYKLTLQGVLVSNVVLADFLSEEEITDK